MSTSAEATMDRVWDVVGKARICMLATNAIDGPRARPMEARPDRASVERDPARARSLWNEKQEAWWDGPEDPNLLVMRVDLARAEMWDGPASSAVVAVEFARARATGQKPDLGENRKKTVNFG